MTKKQNRPADDKARNPDAERKRESGTPGGGQGRKDKIEKSGVYPISAAEAPVQMQWFMAKLRGARESEAQRVMKIPSVPS